MLGLSHTGPGKRAASLRGGVIFVLFVELMGRLPVVKVADLLAEEKMHQYFHFIIYL